jgi:hypothetical protein
LRGLPLSGIEQLPLIGPRTWGKEIILWRVFLWREKPQIVLILRVTIIDAARPEIFGLIIGIGCDRFGLHTRILRLFPTTHKGFSIWITSFPDLHWKIRPNGRATKPGR